MGEAKNRGSYEERRAAAAEENAEAVICVSAEGSNLRIATILRDPEPDQASPAVIFASFINANFEELSRQSWAAYQRSLTAIPAQAESPQLVTDATPRLMGPDGRPLTDDVNIVVA